MATKAEELRDPNSTWNKAADDEPLFILRPKDVFAVYLINAWISLAEIFVQLRRLGKIAVDIPAEKISRVINLREQVRAWQGANTEQMKLPD